MFIVVCLGAQIIDLMMLVVDITKGIQTQTAECLVIGEITCEKMIVVLNKVDLLSAEKREAVIEKVCMILYNKFMLMHVNIPCYGCPSLLYHPQYF